MPVGLLARDEDQETRPSPSRREQTIEVVVFLFLVVPAMALSLFAIQQRSLDFTLVAWATILREAGLVGLILFFLWRNGEPVSRIGWSLKNPWREVALGIGLFIPFCFGAATNLAAGA